MAMGMGYDEFWACHPSRYKAYRKASRLRNEERNREMWIQGHYVFEAIATALHNQPAFCTRPPKQIRYLEKPFDLYGKSEEEVAKEETKKQNEFVDYLTLIQKNWEKKHGNSGKRS